MKRIVAFVLSLALLLSASVVFANAQDNKLDATLKQKLNECDPDTSIYVMVSFNCGYIPPADRMPSWPDKIAARKELRELVTAKKSPIIDELSSDIEFEVFEFNDYSEISILSMRLGDVSALSEYSVVKYIAWFDDKQELEENEVVFANAQDSKLDATLKQKLNECDPDTSVYVMVSFNCGYIPPADRMPSWPDKIAARKELRELVTAKKSPIIDELSSDIEFEVFEFNDYSEISILSMRLGDVSALSEYSVVKYIAWFDDKQELEENESNSDLLYEDLFFERYAPNISEEMKKYSVYDELYYHTDENGDLDWVLVNADLNGGTFGEQVLVYIFMKTRAVIWPFHSGAPFHMCHAVYDVKADEFVDLVDVGKDTSKYKDIETALDELKIGYPYGDADLDGEITIMDATFIQRYLAKKTALKENTCDIDGDGEITILDATTIQIKLAKIEE